MARGEWGEGYRCIGDITERDEVLSRYEFDTRGPLEWKRVEETFTRFAEVFNLHAGGIIVRTTAEHPFFVAERFAVVGGQSLLWAFGEIASRHRSQSRCWRTSCAERNAA